MVEVRPLRGVRFDPEVTGAVGPLLAPPYDVAAGTDGSSAFSIRRIEDVDLGSGGDDHAVAAERYRDWLQRGVLRRETAAAMYVHRHWFQAGEQSFLRTGLLARVRLADWEDRVVLPHERTTPGPRRERLARLRAVNANLSPLYFLYRDPDQEIHDLLARQVPAAAEPPEADRMGGFHQLDVVSDPALHAALRETFAARRVFVADGHHRYEAALAYRNECRHRYGYDPDASWEFVLTLLAAVEDPGVRVLPTHRAIQGPAGLPAALRELLARWFELDLANSPRRGEGQPLFRVALAEAAEEWTVWDRSGNPHLALLPAGRSSAWRSLEVSAVAGVLDSLFGVPRDDAPRVRPVVDEKEAVRQVSEGRAAAAFLLPAPSLDRLLATAEAGDLLPPKSTWFEPKAPAGLVINDLSL
jgi:uncharacterized protein (DUF1015 family)